MSVISAIRWPTTRPVLPRASSGTSGFFFCGMIELPVQKRSAMSMKPKDWLIHSTSSSLSRLSEELVLWMSQSFGFIDIADRFCTGSSIMPQKKNPDVPELARGKTGRVVGHLMALITLMKGQPLAYNKDNQEDKEPLFDTVDTLKDTLRIFAEMVGGITVKPEAMEKAA